MFKSAGAMQGIEGPIVVIIGPVAAIVAAVFVMRRSWQTLVAVRRRLPNMVGVRAVLIRIPMVAPFAVMVSFGSHAQLAELGDTVWAVHVVIVVDDIV